MLAVTAPDFAGPVRELPRLDDTPGTVLELLVLAARANYCAGVDLASGALVRAWAPAPLGVAPRAYDTLAVVVDGGSDTVPDPNEPEGLPLTGEAAVTGRLGRRRAEPLLRPLLHPAGPLLGVHAPAVPFWSRRPDHPSIALVEPPGAVTLLRDGDYLNCRFPWRGTVVALPCLDERLAGAMDRAERTRWRVGRGHRLVVALHPPIDGHCHKVVEAVLPRP